VAPAPVDDRARVDVPRQVEADVTGAEAPDSSASRFSGVIWPISYRTPAARASATRSRLSTMSKTVMLEDGTSSSFSSNGTVHCDTEPHPITRIRPGSSIAHLRGGRSSLSAATPLFLSAIRRANGALPRQEPHWAYEVMLSPESRSKKCVRAVST
jgi:hypothetical protein